MSLAAVVVEFGLLVVGMMGLTGAVVGIEDWAFVVDTEDWVFVVDTEDWVVAVVVVGMKRLIVEDWLARIEERVAGTVGRIVVAAGTEDQTVVVAGIQVRIVVVVVGTEGLVAVAQTELQTVPVDTAERAAVDIEDLGIVVAETESEADIGTVSVADDVPVAGIVPAEVVPDTVTEAADSPAVAVLVVGVSHMQSAGFGNSGKPEQFHNIAVDYVFDPHPAIIAGPAVFHAAVAHEKLKLEVTARVATVQPVANNDFPLQSLSVHHCSN